MTKPRIIYCLSVPWLAGSTLFVLLHLATERTYASLLISSLIREYISAVSPYGIVNSTVVPGIVNIVVWSAALFASLALFLNIKNFGLQFRLRSIFIAIGLLALIFGVSAGTPDPANRLRPSLILLVCFLISGISIFNLTKTLGDSTVA